MLIFSYLWQAQQAKKKTREINTRGNAIVVNKKFQNEYMHLFE